MNLQRRVEEKAVQIGSPRTGRPGHQLDPRYGLLTLAYMAGIYGLSYLPGLGVRAGDPLVQVASNLFHIPLYAGLAFCLLRAISGGQASSWGLDGLTLLGAGAYALLDEWHQSFVPGRYASVGDILLNLVGIVGMLLLLRLGAFRRIDP